VVRVDVVDGCVETAKRFLHTSYSWPMVSNIISNYRSYSISCVHHDPPTFLSFKVSSSTFFSCAIPHCYQRYVSSYINMEADFTPHQSLFQA
jgi:hypothetical protein